MRPAATDRLTLLKNMNNRTIVVHRKMTHHQTSDKLGVSSDDKILTDHISPVLHQLHWLPVRQRVMFKVATLACLPVPVRPYSGLPGRRLSTRHRRSCQTNAFCRHSNARCQPDIQQFQTQDLRSCWNQSVEQFAARPETTGTVIRPVQAVTEDIFIWTVRPRHSVNSFNCTVEKYSYLVTYIYLLN